MCGLGVYTATPRTARHVCPTLQSPAFRAHIWWSLWIGDREGQSQTHRHSAKGTNQDVHGE